MSSFDISEWVVKIPVLLFAITAHEYAHGRMAYALGDPTARDLGRLTLNPLPHIDPFGALCLFLFNFGWAKPVPVDARYFRKPGRDMVLVSLAGPAANFALALLSGMLIRHALFPVEVYQIVLFYVLFMNLGLGLFNLIPIPPLDGSHILENLLPAGPAQRYRELGRYGGLALMVVILLDNWARLGILNALLLRPMRLLAGLFAGISL